MVKVFLPRADEENLATQEDYILQIVLFQEFILFYFIFIFILSFIQQTPADLTDEDQSFTTTIF